MNDGTMNGSSGTAKPEPAQMAPPCCFNCIYYFPEKENQQKGNCHRRSPDTLLGGQSAAIVGQNPRPILWGVWPPVSADKLCGEHQMYLAYAQAIIAHNRKVAAERAAAAEADGAAAVPAEPEAGHA
jgi:hypothetical protein